MSLGPPRRAPLPDGFMEADTANMQSHTWLTMSALSPSLGRRRVGVASWSVRRTCDIYGAQQRAFPAVVGADQDVVFAWEPCDRTPPSAEVLDRHLLDAHRVIFLRAMDGFRRMSVVVIDPGSAGHIMCS